MNTVVKVNSHYYILYGDFASLSDYIGCLAKCYSITSDNGGGFYIRFVDLENRSMVVYTREQTGLGMRIIPVSKVLSKYLKLFE